MTKRDKVALSNKKYRVSEKGRTANKKYLLSKKGIATRKRNYYKWVKDNPYDYALMRKVGQANFTAKKFECKGKIRIKDIRTLITDPFVCYYCGELLSVELGIKKIWELDHKVPLSRGGSNTLNNIVACHHGCNRRKGLQTKEEFIEFCQKVVNQFAREAIL